MLILTCPDGFVGVSQYLKGIESNIENSCFVSLNKLPEDLVTFLEEKKASTIIFGGLANSAIIRSSEQIKKELPKIKIFFTWHSTFLQTELSEELSKFNTLIMLVNDNVIDGVICGDIRITDTMTSLNEKYKYKFFFLPNLIDTTSFDENETESKTFITCFGPDSPRKNRLSNLIAMMLLQKKYPDLEYITNFSQITFNLSDERSIIYRKWLERIELQLYMKRALVGICTTASESFNYNMFEYLLYGTSVVTTQDQYDNISNQLKRMNLKSSNTMIDSFIKTAPLEDPIAIYQSIEELLSNRQTLIQLGRRAQDFVIEYNYQATSFFKDKLELLIS